jgi:hypothetical protein
VVEMQLPKVLGEIYLDEKGKLVTKNIEDIIKDPYWGRDTRKKLKRFVNEMLPDETILALYLVRNNVLVVVDEPDIPLHQHKVKLVDLDNFEEKGSFEATGELYRDYSDLMKSTRVSEEIKDKVSKYMAQVKEDVVLAFYVHKFEKKAYVLLASECSVKLFDVDELLQDC